MEKSSFFDSINRDRLYKAQDYANYFNKFITNGVFPNPATNLQVIANNNMTVTLKKGAAWINGYMYENTEDLILNVSTSDGIQNRIDRLVIRLDTAGRAITAKIKKGTLETSPTAPALQRDADGYELGIADIYVGKGVAMITQANITDLRMNTNISGWVNSLIQADTNAIFNQYVAWYNEKTGQYQSDMTAMKTQFENDFNSWYNNIKSQLSGDVATNLQNQIGTLGTLNTTNKSSLVNAVNEVNASLADKVSLTLIKSSPLEIGQWIDFHNSESATDYDARLHWNGTNFISSIPTQGNKKMLNQDDYDTLFQYANEGKQLANLIGGAVSSASTWALINIELTNTRNRLIAEITNKGVSVDTSKGMWEIAGKIGEISTGKKWASGAIPGSFTNPTTISGLAFVPKYIICGARASSEDTTVVNVGFAGLVKNPNTALGWQSMFQGAATVRVFAEPTGTSFTLNGTGGSISDVWWLAIEG